MLGRPRLYTSYKAEAAIFPTWTQRTALVLLGHGTDLNKNSGGVIYLNAGRIRKRHGSSAPFHTPRPGWSLNRLITWRSRCSFAVSPGPISDSSLSHGSVYMPERAAASMYSRSRWT